MTRGSMTYLTNVEKTPAKQLNIRAIYDPFRTISGVVGSQQRIRDGTIWFNIGSKGVKMSYYLFNYGMKAKIFQNFTATVLMYNLS